MPALLRRILLAPIPRLLWTGILALLLGRLVFWISPALMRAPNVTLTGASRNAALTVLVLAAGLWLFERKRPRDAGLGLSGSVSQTSRGFLVGALLLTAVTGVLALTGSYRILGWAPVPDGTTRAALLGRAVLIFLGFGHRNNPGATWVSSVAIAIEAGALLAAAYVATRSLWLPIGLHWAWNLFEGPVWGSPVSGIGLPVIANARFPGPRLLTGGDFGPEAGLPAMVLGAALGVWFLVLAIRRDQIVTPAWMRWLAGRLRRRPELLEPASAPAPVTPSSAG